MPIIRELLPVISSQLDLARFLEISDSLLEAIQKHPESRYRIFYIPKRRGGIRRIEAPQPSLQALQKKIADEILSKVVFHDAAHGFITRRSIISNAERHRWGRHFLHLDLKDFFASTKSEVVEQAFASLGYQLPVAHSLARICCARGALPQGAPTSPALSNLCAKNLDIALTSIAEQNNLVYTRYADDITFSGHFISLTFVKITQRAIEASKYELNDQKTLLTRNGGKNIVTGISVSRKKLCVPRNFKRAARSAAHFLLRNGVVSESRRSGIFDPLHVDRVLGRLAYWHQVEPDNIVPPEARKAILQKLDHLKRETIPPSVP